MKKENKNVRKKQNLTIGIVGGRGTLGKIFKKFFRSQGYKVLISGRKTKLTSSELVKKSDIVIFSVPIIATTRIIGEMLPYTRKEQLLMDFTSIKEGPIKEMLKTEAAVIGLHPMFGKIESLKGKTIIIVPARPRKWMNWLVPLLKKGQINVKITDARKHDEIMAILQGLIHFNFISLSYALGEISKKNKVRINDLLDYGGVIYRLRLGMIARVLSQDPGLYADIAMLNKNSNKLFKEYEKTAKKLKEIIREKDKKEFERIFKEASKFFGGFRKQALKESNFLIEQLLEYSNKNKKNKKMKIAVLGPKGTFSELAAEHYIGKTNKRAEIVLCKNIPEIFDFLAQKKADYGIAPLENLLDGSVSEVLDLLYDSDIFINAEFIVEVHHCIASTSPNIKNIKRVVSIPKALAQCLGYIRKNNLDMIETISTAEAMRLIAEKKETDLAAIGSERAAKEYKLNILERNIEDKNHNVTRFAVISRNKNKKEKGKEYKTSIVIHPTSDRPGLLYDLLKSFAERKINLTKIESRPTKIKLGDYLFYIDFEGYEEDEKVEQAIKEIEKLAKVKIFGSYERVK